MKVTELMIGDWVSYNGHSVLVEALNKSNGYAIEKDMISIKLNDDTCLGINAERLEPLRVTDEIILKNGFKITEQNEMGYIHYEIEEPEYVEIENFSRHFTLTIWSYSDIVYHKDISYVHEIQHAFKNHDVEKEIIV